LKRIAGVHKQISHIQTLERILLPRQRLQPALPQLLAFSTASNCAKRYNFLSHLRETLAYTRTSARTQDSEFGWSAPSAAHEASRHCSSRTSASPSSCCCCCCCCCCLGSVELSLPLPAAAAAAARFSTTCPAARLLDSHVPYIAGPCTCK
jgi:hypothetical protein